MNMPHAKVIFEHVSREYVVYVTKIMSGVLLLQKLRIRGYNYITVRKFTNFSGNFFREINFKNL